MTRSRRRSARRPGLLPALVAALATLTLAVGLVGPARAADAPSGTPAADQLRLVAQTDWVADGGSFTIRVAVPPGLPDDAELVLDLHRSVTSRSQFTATREGRLLGRRLAELVVPLGELPVMADGSRRVHLTPTPSGAPGERQLPALPSSGVHPLVVSLRPPDPGDEEPAPLTTYLVRTPDAVVQPLRVALVQPLGAPPAHRSDGTVAFDDGVVDELAALAEVLADAPVPLSLEPRPETVQALQQLADRGDDVAARAVEALRAAVQGRQVVAAPYVPVDPAALAAAGLAGQVEAQRERGRDVVGDLLGVRPDDATWVAGSGLAPSTLERLVGLGVRHVVLPDASLERVALRLSLTRPFEVPIDDGAVLATTPDPALSARYAAADPVLAAKQALADLAVLHGDEPGARRPRGVVVAPPEEVDTDPRFLAEVLAGLASAPHLEPTTLRTYLAEVDPEEVDGEVLARRSLAEAGGRFGVPGAEVTATRARIAGYASMVQGGADSAAIRALADRVLVAEAEDLAPAERRRYLDAVDQTIAASIGSVRIVDRAAYRLPDSEGTIPLTIVHDSSTPLTVQVTLASDKLAFGDGDDRREGRVSYDLALEQENTPLVVPVSVRSPGTFPLVVTITSPDGSLEVLETRVTVRSTAFSGVGVALSIGAGAFLLLWWGRHWRTTRRDRRLVPAP